MGGAPPAAGGGGHPMGGGGDGGVTVKDLAKLDWGRRWAVAVNPTVGAARDGGGGRHGGKKRRYIDGGIGFGRRRWKLSDLGKNDDTGR